MNKLENKTNKQSIKTTSFITSDTHGEAIYDQNTKQTNFAIHHNKTIKIQQSYTEGNHRYIQSPQLNKLIQSQTILLPEAVTDFESMEKLIADIRQFIHRYVDVSESFEIISTYYVLLTWLYDKYNELPYLRVRGDYGSGKTRFLRVIGSLTYKPIFASGASTTAPLFHLLDSIQGTLIMDESDFRYSDTTAELTKILNNGNMKGFSVLRCEQSTAGRFYATSYHIYGPKVVAARESFTDDALESRFITEDLGDKAIRQDIPISLPASFAAEALALRNQLLQFRFCFRKTPIALPESHELQLSGRTEQIYQPLLSLIKAEDDKAKVYQHIHTYETQLKSDRGLATEAELLRVIHQLQTEDKLLSISEISKAFMLGYGLRYTRRITPKWIGHLIRSKLHLATRKANGVYIITEGQQDKLQHLMHRYDVL